MAETDSEGKVKLGDLEKYDQIEQVRVSREACGSWFNLCLTKQLNSIGSEINKSFTIVEGEDLLLPTNIDNQRIEPKLYNIQKYKSDGKTFEKLAFEKIKPDPDSPYRLLLSGLDHGFYRFTYFNLDTAGG